MVACLQENVMFTVGDSANVGCLCGSISLYDSLLLKGYWLHI
jgi:hypothetical protein